MKEKHMNEVPSVGTAEAQPSRASANCSASPWREILCNAGGMLSCFVVTENFGKGCALYMAIRLLAQLKRKIFSTKCE